MYVTHATISKIFVRKKILSHCKCFRYAYKQLLDEVFVISGIIKVEVSVISRSRSESTNCFLYLFFKGNNDKRTVEEANRPDVFTSLCARCHSPPVNLTLSWKSCIAHATYRLVNNLLVHEPVGWSVSSGGINLNGNFF